MRALAGVLAPRERWSERDLARLTRRFATRAAEELYLTARFDRAERWHLRLALTEEVEVWLLTWTPWQGTEQHDHGGAAGAYTVLHGELTETWTDRRGRTKRSVRPAGSSASYGAGPRSLRAEPRHAGGDQRARVLAATTDRARPHLGSG